MIYEWYSGSDRSGKVPSGLARLDQSFDEAPAQGRLERLQALLSREKDPNWRGYLLVRLAGELKAAGQTDDARRRLAEAIEEFEPLAGNIRDVMPHYAEALQRMIFDHLRIEQDAEAIAQYAMILAANMGESRLASRDMALSYCSLARVLHHIGREHELPICYRLALNFALRAHHAEPDDPVVLEAVVHAYFNVGDREHCRLAYEMFGKAGPAEELKDRVDKFMRLRFREIGGTLEISS